MSSRRYYVLTASGELGPHSRQELAELERDGRISPDDRLRTAFGTNAGTVAELLSDAGDGGSEGEVEMDGFAPPATPSRNRRGSRTSGPGRAHRRDAEEVARPGLPLVPIGLAAVVLIGGIGLWALSGPRGAPPPPTSAPQPTVTISASPASWELGDEGSFTVHLDQEAPAELTIPLEIAGSAVPGVDVVPVATSVTIRAGGRTAQVPVVPLPASIRRQPAVSVTAAIDRSMHWAIGTPREATVPLLADAARSAGPRLTWLSTLPFAHEWNWGKAPNRDRSQDDNTLTIEGVTYESGLGMHAGQAGRDPEVHATFKLAGAYDEFLSDVGIDDESREKGSAVFQVWVDERKEFDSGLMTFTDRAKSLRVRVSGAQTLRLVVLDGGDNQDWDHSDWGGARLIKRR